MTNNPATPPDWRLAGAEGRAAVFRRTVIARESGRPSDRGPARPPRTGYSAFAEYDDPISASRPYSAGLAAGGGGAAEGGAGVALAAAAFFSTIRTAMIEPS